jgi:formate dehydrogenase (coenzyme F420) beta subunit
MMNTAKKLNEQVGRAESYAAATEEIRAAATRLLEAGDVAAVVGYRAGRRQGTALPCIATTVEQAAELVFSPGCHHNLALYLTRNKKELRRKGRLAVVVKGCDLRAVAGLITENQLRREDVVLLGVACAGVAGPQQTPQGSLAAKCEICRAQLPEGTDQVLGVVPESAEAAPAVADELARLEALTPAERWSFWKEHFARCTRCYACRQVCPLCYCEQCLCDRNRPQAVESTARPAGNMAWHIVRAMHLAGRCAGCAECERSCPMDIPLHLLNRKMAKELKELYDHEAGSTPQEKGPLNDYREDDDQSFIK